MYSYAKNNIGKQFNRLIILKVISSSDRGSLVLCQCVCGNKTAIQWARIKSGNTKSCGCLVTETRLTSNRTHGLRYHRLYKIWLNMKQRCSNSKLKCYKYYGGKGIRVCKRWEKFINFYNDMFPTYKVGFDLDREKGSGNYTPSNCRWLLHKRNSQRRNYCKLNYRKAKFIRKRKLSVKDLALKYSVTECAIRHVLNNKTWI